MAESTWTEDQVRDLLKREDFRYQDIELPYGLSTGGADRQGTSSAIFPADLSGKTVLDIGCRYGYFCFEAAKRGAKRVVGVDFDAGAIRKARLLNECKGMSVEFELLDMERDPLPGEFDYVLCLNILHHLRNPISALDKMIAGTRERLILEVANLSRKDAKKFSGEHPLSWLVYPVPLLVPVLDRLPTVMLGGNKRAIEEMFFFSPVAIERLLMTQRRCFSSLQIKERQHKGRFVAIADKLRIDQLLVLAGPIASGKSTLIDELSRGRHEGLGQALGIGDLSDWRVALPNHMSELESAHVEKMVLHYDFLRPYKRGPYEHRRDKGLDVLYQADCVRTLTLWVDSRTLAKRHHAREIAPNTRFGRYWGKKRHKKVQEAYRDPERTHFFYEKWFDHLEAVSGEHFVFDLETGNAPLLLAEWRAKVGV